MAFNFSLNLKEKRAFFPSEMSVMASIVSQTCSNNTANRISISLFKEVTETDAETTGNNLSCTTKLHNYSLLFSIDRFNEHPRPFIVLLFTNLLKLIFIPIALSFATSKDVFMSNIKFVKTLLEKGFKFHYVIASIFAFVYATSRAFIALIVGLVSYHLFYFINILVRMFKINTKEKNANPPLSEDYVNPNESSPPIEVHNLGNVGPSAPSMNPYFRPPSTLKDVLYYSDGIVYQGKAYFFKNCIEAAKKAAPFQNQLLYTPDITCEKQDATKFNGMEKENETIIQIIFHNADSLYTSISNATLSSPNIMPSHLHPQSHLYHPSTRQLLSPYMPQPLTNKTSL